MEIDITSIKRKQATLMAMSNVLNEFLSNVSKGFQDAAFASFSRRRSTVREDLAQSFGDGTAEDTKPSENTVASSKAPVSTAVAVKDTESTAARATEGAAPKRGGGRRGRPREPK